LGITCKDMSNNTLVIISNLERPNSSQYIYQQHLIRSIIDQTFLSIMSPHCFSGSTSVTLKTLPSPRPATHPSVGECKVDETVPSGRYWSPGCTACLHGLTSIQCSLQQVTPPCSTRQSLDDRRVNEVTQSVENSLSFTGEQVIVNSKAVTPLSPLSHTRDQTLYFTHFQNHPSLDCFYIIRQPSDLVEGIKSFLTSRLSTPLVVFNVTNDLYQKTLYELPTIQGRLRYEYNWINEKMIVYPHPTPVHESISSFMDEIRNRLNSDLRSHNVRLMDTGSSLITLKDENLVSTRDKIADRTYTIRCDGLPPAVYPCLVVETRYPELNPDPMGDATHWLWESLGEVLAVIMVKFTKPWRPVDFSNVEKWKGWIQVYTRGYVGCRSTNILMLLVVI
jgi:hypothetical protein